MCVCVYNFLQGKWSRAPFNLVLIYLSTYIYTVFLKNNCRLGFCEKLSFSVYLFFSGTIISQFWGARNSTHAFLALLLYPYAFPSYSFHIPFICRWPQKTKPVNLMDFLIEFFMKSLAGGPPSAAGQLRK